mmetsp:Transcript_70782/g.166926  ORF Transcript_70782/g.166926 Transcript_70782/m.166926 type:complete len:277 (+) Transcript_70782:376-1206(+)
MGSPPWSVQHTRDSPFGCCTGEPRHRSLLWSRWFLCKTESMARWRRRPDTSHTNRTRIGDNPCRCWRGWDIRRRLWGTPCSRSVPSSWQACIDSLGWSRQEQRSLPRTGTIRHGCSRCSWSEQHTLRHSLHRKTVETRLGSCKNPQTDWPHDKLPVWRCPRLCTTHTQHQRCMRHSRSWQHTRPATLDNVPPGGLCWVPCHIRPRSHTRCSGLDLPLACIVGSGHTNHTRHWRCTTRNPSTHHSREDTGHPPSNTPWTGPHRNRLDRPQPRRRGWH